MNKTLTIGFSTLYKNYESLKKKIDAINSSSNSALMQNIEFLVIVQDSPADKIKKYGNIDVHYSVERGLSKSRNKVISFSYSKYIWFLDDDVTLTCEDLHKVLKYLSLFDADLFLGQIKSLDSDKPYKNYRRPFRSIFWPLRSSSIEIIVSRSFIQNNNISFNENLGLGTDYPTGEENDFLIECKKKSVILKFIEEPIIKHPYEDKQRLERISKNIDKIIKVQGYLCKKYGFLLGPIIFLYWSIKFTLKYKRISVLYHMYSGFFEKF